MNLGIVADDPELLVARFEELFATCDAVMTTGGVSMGRYDLVGPAFERCGVTPLLHKIAIKPGKPLWFGMRGRVPVFGLPGNPVSCLVGFEVFVRPAQRPRRPPPPCLCRPPCIASARFASLGDYLNRLLARAPPPSRRPVVAHADHSVAPEAKRVGPSDDPQLSHQLS